MEKELKTNQLLPYEKCKTYGFEALSDAELIAIILRSGTKRNDCITVANDVINHTIEKNLIGLQRLTIEDLLKIDGIGEVKAIQLKSICELSRRMSFQTYRKRPSITTAKDAADYCMESMRHLENEQLRLLFLDTKKQLIKDEIISIGDIAYTVVSQREICKRALLSNCLGIIMLHNHPSGDPTPSDEDIKTTYQVRDALNLVGIELIDHIIIGDNKYISLRYEHLIN